MRKKHKFVLNSFQGQIRASVYFSKIVELKKLAEEGGSKIFSEALFGPWIFLIFSTLKNHNSSFSGTHLKLLGNVWNILKIAIEMVVLEPF